MSDPLPRLLAGLPADGSALRWSEHLAVHGPPSMYRGKALLAEVESSGLTGRGGAGFPTARKLLSVADAAGRSARAPVVVANGAEGEPASSKDLLLLACLPHLVLDGITAAASAVGARRAVLCLHEGSTQTSSAIDRIETALAERDSADVDPCAIELSIVPARYVASEESALVQWLSKGVALPTTRPPRPDQHGVDGRPTLVNNVETLAHLGLIARYGAGWFSETGTKPEPGTRLVTVSGAVAAPGVLEVETGTRIADALGMCGGLTEPAAGYLIGGYFGGWVSAESAPVLRLSRAGLAGVGGALGAGVLIALPASVCPLREASRVLSWLAAQSAGQCGPCRFGLPSIAGAFETLSRGRLNAAGHRQLEHWMRDVSGRGACRHPDGTVRFASSALQTFRGEVTLHARGQCSAPGGRSPSCPLPDPRSERPSLAAGRR
jgi:NADH:ubiquinone oxidoreductase subunit F (NADH-binding)